LKKLFGDCDFDASGHNASTHGSPENVIRADDVDLFIERMQASLDYDVSGFGVWGRVSMIHELHHALVGEALKPLGLSFNEYQIIGILYLAGPPFEMNPRELIKLKLMTTGGITNLLSRMEAAGLITRRPSDVDRREVIVTLTELGKAKSKASLDDNMEQRLIAEMTEEEVAVLSTLLRKLLRSVNSFR
jgi:DNA-binding MarR family transcriptional regulator